MTCLKVQETSMYSTHNLNNKSLKFWRAYLMLTNQIFPTLRGVGVEEKCQRLNSIFGFASFFIISPQNLKLPHSHNFQSDPN